MALETIKRYISSIIYSVILLGLLGVSLSVAAQQELTREERIKILEQLKMEDKKIEVNTLGLISSKTSIDIENLELPPLSVFLDAVTENASVKRAQSQVEQVKNQYRLEKRNWWNYFRLNGNYSYGRYNIIAMPVTSSPLCTRQRCQVPSTTSMSGPASVSAWVIYSTVR